MLEAIEAGKKIILEIDVQGGIQVHEKLPDAQFSRIAPPSEEELRRRLAGRGSETDETLQRRLEKANAEVASSLSIFFYTHYFINYYFPTSIL